MTKAYRCDRCRECFDGVPKEELEAHSRGEMIQLCEKCYEVFVRFIEKKDEKGEGA